MNITLIVDHKSRRRRATYVVHHPIPPAALNRKSRLDLERRNVAYRGKIVDDRQQKRINYPYAIGKRSDKAKVLGYWGLKTTPSDECMEDNVPDVASSQVQLHTISPKLKQSNEERVGGINNDWYQAHQNKDYKN